MDALTQLRNLASNTDKKKDHGARIRKALMSLAIPATAALCSACYGAPMAVPPVNVTHGPSICLDGADLDHDGLPECPCAEHCEDDIETQLTIADG